MPILTPTAVPGLFLGCLLANIYTGNIIDIVLGSLATLTAAALTYKTRSNKWLAISFPLVINAVVVGGYLGIYFPDEFPVYLTMIFVGVGQVLACYGLGLPLYHILKRRMNN